MGEAFETLRGAGEQLGNGCAVPVGVGDLGVSDVGRQGQHLAIDIGAVLIPAQQPSRYEGMSQIPETAVLEIGLPRRPPRARLPAGEIASVTVALGLSGYDHDEAERFFDRARERVRALPGGQAASRASRAPLSINFSRERHRAGR